MPNYHYGNEKKYVVARLVRDGRGPGGVPGFERLAHAVNAGKLSANFARTIAKDWVAAVDAARASNKTVSAEMLDAVIDTAEYVGPRQPGWWGSTPEEWQRDIEITESLRKQADSCQVER